MDNDQQLSIYETIRNLSNIYGYGYDDAKSFFDQQVEQGVPPVIALTATQLHSVMQFSGEVNSKITGPYPRMDPNDYDTDEAYKSLMYFSKIYGFSYDQVKEYFDNLIYLDYDIGPAITLTKLHFIDGV